MAVPNDDNAKLRFALFAGRTITSKITLIDELKITLDLFVKRIVRFHAQSQLAQLQCIFRMQGFKAMTVEFE